MSNTEFQRKLRKLYGEEPVKNDVFGRRQATPREIQDSMRVDFKSLVDRYLPTKEDIDAKHD